MADIAGGTSRSREYDPGGLRVVIDVIGGGLEGRQLEQLFAQLLLRVPRLSHHNVLAAGVEWRC
ncbi:MAG: hypothetical protein ACYDHU_08255 [Acidimicrobiales bacterium]